MCIIHGHMTDTEAQWAGDDGTRQGCGFRQTSSSRGDVREIRYNGQHVQTRIRFTCICRLSIPHNGGSYRSTVVESIMEILR